jgi:mRNA interferase RelE/StbE
MFEVVLLPDAEKIYRAAGSPLAKKLARCFARLERDPRRYRNITPLSGPLAGYFRYRVGDYRVIYQIDDLRRTVYVYKISHRREAYR